MTALQHGAADRLSGGDPPGPHQAAGLFGEQPVAAGIGRAQQPDRAFQQVRGDIGRCGRGFPGRLGQPSDGLGVCCSGSAGEVLGDQQGRGMHVRQSLPGLAVQRAADAEREVFVDGVADQVVAEPQPVAVVFQHPRGRRAEQR
jgi:hypothetical protein